MNTLSFWISGVPVGKGSMKAFYVKKLNRAVITHDNKRTKPWQSLVSLTASEEAMKQGWELVESNAILIRMTFNLQRPKGHYGSGKNADKLKPSAPQENTKAPDVDKLARLMLDAFTGILWRDDSQVVTLQARKCYTHGMPGVSVEVDAIGEPQ